MVNDLRSLMSEASGHAPHDQTDLAAVLRHGRRRVRVRRASIVGGVALAAGAITVASMSWLNPAPSDLAAAGVPRVEGPSMRLTDARPAVEGTDYRVLSSYTNEDLNADNGQYYDGVTDDGLILFRDGPRSHQLYPRFALMDPTTGEKDWLPKVDLAQSQTWPLELGADRLVLLAVDDNEMADGALTMSLIAHVFDRETRQWSGMKWPDLPSTDGPWSVKLGPDGRLYIPVPATQGKPPKGGWPMGPDGEADDADAEGDTFDLWSVSLSDPEDIRNENLRVGSIGFTDDSMVWTDSENGAAGMVHVRDLASGEETSFDPELGERCNLLGFSVAGERIAMSQYCGTYEGPVRDDRVQVFTTDGEPVITIQDSGVEGGVLSADGDFMTVTAYERATGATYVYDFEDGTLLRVSDGTSSWAIGTGPTPADQFMWTTPAGGADEMFGTLGGRSGAKVWLGELID